MPAKKKATVVEKAAPKAGKVVKKAIPVPVVDIGDGLPEAPAKRQKDWW